MLINKFTVLLKRFLGGYLYIDYDTDPKIEYKIFKSLDYIIEHTQIEGTKDGIKITFKKEI